MNDQDRIPVKIHLLKYLQGNFNSVEEKAEFIPQLSQYLHDYLLDRGCTRYLCIYYNVENDTHIEFNLLPPDIHIPQKEPGKFTCFRQVIKDGMTTCINTEGNCGSQRCPTKLPSIHDVETINKVTKRWDSLESSLTEDNITNNFWFDYELFLHKIFDPFTNYKTGNKISYIRKDILHTNLFKIFKEKEMSVEDNDFYERHSIFKGDDSWFTDPDGFDLSYFNITNNLSTKFYGCYLIPPEQTRQHAAILLAYVNEHFNDDSLDDTTFKKKCSHDPDIFCSSEKEVWRVGRLLGFLSQLCWPTLNREISKDLAAAAKKAAEAEQMKASHRLLLHLQRPLDALMKAFDNVQSEAQEMHAILNNPEEGIFQAHKLLAQLFQDNRDIMVTDYLSVKTQHEWTYDQSKFEEFQRAYCFALCSIFGVEDNIKSAQSQEAIVQLSRSVLKDARHKGVYDNLIQVIKNVCLIDVIDKENAEIEDTVSLLKHEANDKHKAGERFVTALVSLKVICYSPFKDINSKWYRAPVAIASTGDKFEWSEEYICAPNKEVKTEKRFKYDCILPSDTPFAQHAILNFIIDVRKYFNDTNIELKIASDSDKKYLEYTLKIDGEFYDKIKDSGMLSQCLDAVVNFGVIGRNLGNFLGIFQNLMRHGLGIVDIKNAKNSDWVLINNYNHSQTVLMCLGKLEEKETSQYSRYFIITQNTIEIDDENICQLRIIWFKEHRDIAS